MTQQHKPVTVQCLASSHNIKWLNNQCMEAYDAARQDPGNTEKRQFFTTAIYYYAKAWFALKHVPLDQDEAIDRVLHGGKSKQKNKEETQGLFTRLLKKLDSDDAVLTPAFFNQTMQNAFLAYVRLKKTEDQQINAPVSADYDWLSRVKAQEVDTPPAFMCIDKETLEKHLDALPTAQGPVLRLFYLEGKPCKEIARQMNLSEEMVKSHMQNGRRMLKKSLIQAGEIQEEQGFLGR